MYPRISLLTIVVSLLVKSSCGFRSFNNDNSSTEETDVLTNDESTPWVVKEAKWFTAARECQKKCAVVFCRSYEHCDQDDKTILSVCVDEDNWADGIGRFMVTATAFWMSSGCKRFTLWDTCKWNMCDAYDEWFKFDVKYPVHYLERQPWLWGLGWWVNTTEFNHWESDKNEPGAVKGMLPDYRSPGRWLTYVFLYVDQPVA